MKTDGKLQEATIHPDGYLIGRVAEDFKGRFNVGEQIQTSLIKKIYVETANSVYEVELRPHPWSWMP